MNPFKVDASVAVSSIDTKFIMIYSKNDRIVSYEHSKELAQKCKKNPVEIEIVEDHNKPRKKDITGLRTVLAICRQKYT